MQKKVVLYNIIWSVLGMLTTTFVSMVILPRVSDTLGIEAYGYISLSNNIISYIDLIAATINVYAVNYISMAYHEKKWEKANSYFNSVLWADVLIGISVAIPSGICIFYLEKILNISPNLVKDVKLLCSIMLANYIVHIVGIAFGAATFIKNQLHKSSRISTVATFAKTFVIFWLFMKCTPHVWYMGIAHLFYTIPVVFFQWYYTKKLTPEFEISFHKGSWRDVLEIVKSGIWNTLSSLGITLNSGIDLLITNIYINEVMMGTLSVPKMFSNFILKLLSTVSSSFRPQLLLHYSRNEKEKLVEEFKQAMKCCGFVSSLIFSVFVAYGLQFLNLWIPNQNTGLIFRLAVLTFGAEVFTGVVKPLHYACVLTKKLKFPCSCNLGVGVLNAVTMVICLNICPENWGIYIVAITTVIGNVAYNFGIMPIYSTRILNLKYSLFAKFVMKYTFTGVLMVFLLKVLSKVICLNAWGGWLVNVSVAAVAGSLIYFFMMFDYSEKVVFLKKIIIKFREKA